MDENLQHGEAAKDTDITQIPTKKIKRPFWYLMAALIFLTDQVSKWAVTELLVRPNTMGQAGFGFVEWYSSNPFRLPFYSLEITPYFNLVMAWNTGVSFSMFSEYGGYMPLILICVALAITLLFIIWLWKAETNLHALCYALVIGGALGNVIDRARYGAVIDFLDIHVMGHHWPAFNVADMAVVTGISLLIIVSLFFDIRAKDGYRKK